MLALIAENTVLRLLLLATLFALVAAGAYLIANTVNLRRVTRQRLVEDGGRQAGRDMSVSSLRSEQAENSWLKLVNAVEKAGLSLVDTKDANIRQQLIAAGYTGSYAPRVYTLVRFMMVLALPVLAISYLYWTGSTLAPMNLYLTMALMAGLGLYLPNMFIRRRAAQRLKEVINGFPDALDLMLVCVEAGLGLEAAFGRVGMEMTRSHPRLAEQFGAVVLELRAGRSHDDALRRMADRAGADEIRAFATLLIQSTKLGSSIAQTLRVYAGEMRERRRMRAEEKAHRLPVLLSMPLVLCMLPVMIGVLMLPAVIRVVRELLPHLGGG